MNKYTKEYSIFDYFVMAILMSFLGFLLENLWIAFHEGYMDNRNMNFPFLIGYGITIVGFWLVLGVPDDKNVFAYFAKTFFLVSVGEIVLGELGELLCGLYFWDYTSLPFHLTRYTSLFTSIAFSLIITLFMWKLFCPIMDLIRVNNNKPLRIVSTVVISILFLDFLYSFTYMFSSQSFYESWRITIFNSTLFS